MLVPSTHLHHTVLNTTFNGVVHHLSTSEIPIHQFRGIKYASVVARFRQSKLFKAYSRVTDASRYGPVCPQPKLGTVEEDLLGVTENCIPTQALIPNEFECLNLNITCPGGISPDSRLPVMIWIHGGMDRGSGSNWVYDAGTLVRKSVLMDKPVIVVTFNFRIGLLGFAASPILREDIKPDIKPGNECGVGNYGLHDQRCAMRWVNHYIADFGGDPSNVTLFGESTGAADILSHLQSTKNQTRPLFHRAIVQSAIVDQNVPDVHKAGWYLSRVMCTLGVSTLEQLRAVDVSKLIAIPCPFRAIDDGVFFRPGWNESIHLPRRQPFACGHLNTPNVRMARKSLRKSSLSPVRSTLSHSPVRLPPTVLQPLIIGDCSNESIIWSRSASRWTACSVTRRLKAVCQSLSKASTLLRGYGISDASPKEVVSRVLELINDARVAWPTDCVAECAKRERGGHNVWRYVFDQEGPTRGIPHHAADLMYLFDTIPFSALAVHSPCESDTYYGDTLEESQNMEELKLKLHEDLQYDDFVCPEEVMEDEMTDDSWFTPHLDEWNYNRVRDAIQERWICFANGEEPWKENNVFVFGPEGEVGERSRTIFEGRRRRETWQETLEPLGMQLVHKVGVELSNGPPAN